MWAEPGLLPLKYRPQIMDSIKTEEWHPGTEGPSQHPSPQLKSLSHTFTHTGLLSN